MTLPPLPSPDGYKNVMFFDTIEGVYSKEGMVAYGAACRAAALEEAAGICDRFAEREMHPAECAAAIRALRTSGADQQP